MEKTTKPGALCRVVLTRYSGDQVKKTEMGMKCIMYGGEKRCIQSFSGKT